MPLLHGALRERVRIDQARFADPGPICDFPSIVWRCVRKVSTFGRGVHVKPFLLAMPNARARVSLWNGGVLYV